MADKGLVAKSTLTAIANAIRGKTGSSAKMLPSGMAALIESIKGIPHPIQEIEIATCKGSNSTTLSVVCGMSAVPTWVLIETYSGSSTGYEIKNAVAYGSRFDGELWNNTTPVGASGTRTLSNGTLKVTFTSTSVQNFGSGLTYRCIMVR